MGEKLTENDKFVLTKLLALLEVTDDLCRGYNVTADLCPFVPNKSGHETGPIEGRNVKIFEIFDILINEVERKLHNGNIEGEV